MINALSIFANRFESRVQTSSFNLHAQVAELVDALVSNTNIERCAGSSPALGTGKDFSRNAEVFFFAL